MPTKYKIFVKTLQDKILLFNVDSYDIIEGDFVRFTDSKTGSVKQFHSSSCEINEIISQGGKG